MIKSPGSALNMLSRVGTSGAASAVSVGTGLLVVSTKGLLSGPTATAIAWLPASLVSGIVTPSLAITGSLWGGVGTALSSFFFLNLSNRPI